jgi:hypothetical protein
MPFSTSFRRSLRVSPSRCLALPTFDRPLEPSGRGNASSLTIHRPSQSFISRLTAMAYIYRRNRRDHPQGTRHLGRTALETLDFKHTKRMLAFFLTMRAHVQIVPYFREPANRLHLDVLLMILFHRYDRLAFVRRPLRTVWDRAHLTFADLTDNQSYLQTRFLKNDLYRIYDAWAVPDRFTLTNGSVFSGEEATLVFLWRMSRPRRLYDLTHTFGCDETQLSRCFDEYVDFLVDTHSHLLYDNMDYFVNKFQTYNRAIVEKIRKEGFIVPAVARTTIGFYDVCFVRNCRPGSGPEEPDFQRALYGGKEKAHGLKYGAFLVPDGKLPCHSMLLT